MKWCKNVNDNTILFTYNTSGSITQIDDPSQAIAQNFFWNEQQQLTGVSNQQGVHHYVYDHSGERIMKSSLINSTVYLNDQVIDDVSNLEPYTVYVNPYYVVTGLMGGDRVSKHYYMNQQRVATDITINYDPNGTGGGEQEQSLAKDPASAAPELSPALTNFNEVLFGLDQKPLDTASLKLPTIESYYPEAAKTPATSSSAEGNPSASRILFWYHPDYLGNVDLITERDGYTHEFFMYNPWGEEMHQWNANTYAFTSPYRFNSKELDPETGLAYYGARYYQNKLGVWLSVDALASEYIGYAPYNFVLGNPITLIDPDGNAPVAPWWPGVTFTFIESEVSTGVGVGAQAIIQRGVARDEVGKTHFTAGQAKWINASTNRKTEIQGGASVSGTVNVRQSFKRETFWGMLFDEGWNMTGDAGLGVGITLGIGDMEFTVGLGLAAGARIAVGSTEIIESVSLTDNQADFVNKRAADAGVNNSWTVTDVREYGDGWKANVLVGDGKNSVKTNIEVRSSDRKVWMSQEYINAAKKADGFDF